MRTSVTRRPTAALSFLVILLFAVATVAACSSGGDESGGNDDGGSEASASSASATEAGGEGPTAQQCEALQSTQPEDVGTILDQFDEDMAADMQRFAEELEEWQDTGADTTAPPPTMGDALQALYDECVDLLNVDTGTAATAGGEPTFTYESMAVSGGTAVVTVTGTCEDGTFPTGVEMRPPLGRSLAGTDLGDGTYEFTVDVNDTVTAADEANLRAELGLDPADIDDTVTATCG